MMKIPKEFEVGEVPNISAEAGTSKDNTPLSSQSGGESLREEMHAVIGELIRKRRQLEDQLNEEREEQHRETRSFYLKLLVVIDSLDRLIRLADPNNELANSLNALRSEIFLVLEDQEIVPIHLSIGEIFSKETCEAAARKLRPDLPAYTIISIERRGYTWKSQILRRARVTISVLPQGE